ncbi:MAG: hypothetical protein HOP15_00720 [Planctomycetes bacterium]|nr:hypothetical protein [Planctomycetota bacterium]
MKSLACALALSSSSLLAASAAAQDHAALQGMHPGAVSFDAAVKPELEVMRAKTGHLLVRPALNGHEAGWFIFDTGAGICVVSTPLAESFELTSTGDLPASGTGGAAMTQGNMAELLELGPMTLHDVPLMRTDLSFLKEHLGVEVAGVIGYGLLSRCVVELDLRAPRIALHDPVAYTLAAGTWTPLEFDHLIPTVSATYEGRTGRFQLDIGSNCGVTFQEPTVRGFKLLEGRELSDGKLGGVGGFVAVKHGRLSSFELAGLRFDALEASFPLEAKGTSAEEGRDGSIGTKVLESFVLTFDYPGSRICLQPRSGGASVLAAGLGLVPSFARQENMGTLLDRARAALGKAEAAQLEGCGKAHASGLDGSVRVAAASDGRFRVNVDTELPEHIGFDGVLVWKGDRMGLQRVVELEEADVSRLFGWVLSGHWISAPELDVRALDVPSGEAPELELALRGTPMVMTLVLDAATLLPAELRYVDGGAKTVWSFSDYREAAGRRRAHRWSFDGGAGLDTFEIEGWMPVAVDATVFRPVLGPPGDVRFDPEVEPELDVVRLASGHLLVEPWVEGESVGMFIFDTGAGAMTIDPKIADELGLAELGEVVAVGVAGRTTASFRRGTRFELGPVALEDPVYVELDLAFLEPIFGRKVAGIVGYDLLARCVAEIETQTPYVALHDPARFELSLGRWQDLRLNENTPCVRARFEGEHEGLFCIDTGADGTVAFHSPAVVELGLLEGRALSASLSGGVGGASSARSGVLAWFELAGHRFEQKTVQFSLAEDGAFNDRYTLGNIGQGFLAPFRMVLDYPNDRLAFVVLAR